MEADKTRYGALGQDIDICQGDDAKSTADEQAQQIIQIAGGFTFDLPIHDNGGTKRTDSHAHNRKRLRKRKDSVTVGFEKEQK